METTFIYGLFEGENIRYIGKSNTPLKRFAVHLRDKNPSHKRNWITSLLAKGQKPTIEIIDEVPLKDWQFWEQHYICLYKSWGFDLVNGDNGGLGKTKATAETRKRLSELNTGQKRSEQARLAMRIAAKNRKRESHSAETKAKISLGNKGKKVSEETRAKLAEVNRGKKQTDEVKAKLAKVWKGRKHSEETLAKMRGKVLTPEQRAKLSAAVKERHRRNREQKQVNNIF